MRGLPGRPAVDRQRRAAPVELPRVPAEDDHRIKWRLLPHHGLRSDQHPRPVQHRPLLAGVHLVQEQGRGHFAVQRLREHPLRQLRQRPPVHALLREAHGGAAAGAARAVQRDGGHSQAALLHRARHGEPQVLLPALPGARLQRVPDRGPQGRRALLRVDCRGRDDGPRRTRAAAGELARPGAALQRGATGAGQCPDGAAGPARRSPRVHRRVLPELQGGAGTVPGQCAEAAGHAALGARADGHGGDARRGKVHGEDRVRGTLHQSRPLRLQRAGAAQLEGADCAPVQPRGQADAQDERPLLH